MTSRCVDLFAPVFCSLSSHCDCCHLVPDILHGTEGRRERRKERQRESKSKSEVGRPNRAGGSIVRNGNEMIQSSSWGNVKKDEEIKG